MPSKHELSGSLDSAQASFLLPAETQRRVAEVDTDMAVYGTGQQSPTPDEVDWGMHGTSGAAALAHAQKINQIGEGDNYWTTTAGVHEAMVGPVALSRREETDQTGELTLF